MGRAAAVDPGAGRPAGAPVHRGEIGYAICVELRDLIDYHNVRVYRVDGDDVVPVAWRGEVGEYVDEDGEQLRLRVGEGITGWVAQHGLAEYLPDASADPRSATIPGTEDDLDESMLLAPMRYDDRVIGVIVLSKLGLDQFDADDLRYLEIYASMAAQAMVNADAAQQLRAQSERLARQLETQRELIRVTESILSSLDPHTVVAEICDRLGTLVPVDTLGLDLYDPAAGLLIPMYARGVDAAPYLGRSISHDEGVGGWVARNGQPQLVQDELADDRVAHFADAVRRPGALIVAPLHGRDGVAGVLTLERLGRTARFEAWEYELVNLFAGHVSIALANAVTHQAVEHRAMTDALTGLKNQGTFADHLSRAVVRGTPFSLLIVDLDDFKSFNDRDGHEAGNRLLQAIARAVTAAGRETRRGLSLRRRRAGGDPARDRRGGRARGGADAWADAVAGCAPGRVTCSIGVAAFPTDGADRDAVLLAADRACYVAKRSGRARVVTAAEGAGAARFGAHPAAHAGGRAHRRGAAQLIRRRGRGDVRPWRGRTARRGHSPGRGSGTGGGPHGGDAAAAARPAADPTAAAAVAWRRAPPVGRRPRALRRRSPAPLGRRTPAWSGGGAPQPCSGPGPGAHGCGSPAQAGTAGGAIGSMPVSRSRPHRGAAAAGA